MDVSPNELRKQTAATLKEVDDILRGPTQYAVGIRAPLLLAKAQCLNTLTLLRAEQKKR
jgi:hypothetical protein